MNLHATIGHSEAGHQKYIPVDKFDATSSRYKLLMTVHPSMHLVVRYWIEVRKRPLIAIVVYSQRVLTTHKEK